MSLDNDIDKVTQVQMMEFAESARKALNAEGVCLMVAFEGSKSAAAASLSEQDRDKIYQIMRAIAAGSNSVIGNITAGRMKLLLQVDDKEPQLVSELFGVARSAHTTDPREDFKA
ncbi:MAG: hypothetical protein ACR2PR_08150 [Pseudohongiellaceae bacterium]